MIATSVLPSSVFYGPPQLCWTENADRLWFIAPHPDSTSWLAGITQPETDPLLYAYPTQNTALAGLHALWRRDRLVLDTPHSLDWMPAHPHNTIMARRFNTLTWEPASRWLTVIRTGHWLAGHARWTPQTDWEVSTISARWWNQHHHWDETQTTAGLVLPRP